MGPKGPLSWQRCWPAMDEREDSPLAHVGTCSVSEALDYVFVLNGMARE